ncbi:MAG TPA: hypothetical protein VL443_13745 [Cyclobacteriaceae bacterium]|jgi:hypothetical protein|nr:hypothetical protein [Cyclobacteriaceae bacterium]
MNEREKELKAFNQCADALSSLENKNVLKVFHLLSVHFEVISPAGDLTKNDDPIRTEVSKQLANIALDTTSTSDNADNATSKVRRQGKSKSGGIRQPAFLADFNFAPEGMISLREFVSKYNPDSNLECNLVFTHYLESVTKTSGISADHIYTCYRYLNKTIPSFPQTLVDTKSRKGWIDTSDTSNLRVIWSGHNHLQEMEKVVINLSNTVNG